MRIRNIFCLLAALLLALSLTACASTTTTSTPSLTLETSSAEDGTETVVREKPNADDYEDNLIGLLQYMEDGKAVVRDTSASSIEDGEVSIDEDSSAFYEMAYQEIGALCGYRYLFTYNGGSVQAEFYEFDPDNMDEKAQACVNSVKENGYFTILDTDVEATLSEDGRYMMIYNDSKADENDENEAQTEWALELFLSF